MKPLRPVLDAWVDGDGGGAVGSGLRRIAKAPFDDAARKQRPRTARRSGDGIVVVDHRRSELAASKPDEATAVEKRRPVRAQANGRASVAKRLVKIAIEHRARPAPPVERDRATRIDTGGRIKAAGKATQACNDPAKFPFARIAARAAAGHRDLIVHVGDYHYRETPCPDAVHGCDAIPWGYGWDAWAADFFTAASPLLAAAPTAPVRGNHESCARAGQGWWRFLDRWPPGGRWA